MKEYVNMIIQNLKTIGSLAQNEKLNTNDEIFSVCKPSMMQSISRLFFWEGRQSNIDKIAYLLHQTKNECLIIIYTKEKQHELPIETAHTLKVLTESLECFIDGIQNMSQTYRDDIAYRNKLEMILDDAKNFLDLLHSKSN